MKSASILARLLIGSVVASATMAPFVSAVAAEPPGADIRRDAVVRAVEEVMPSVVNISTETIIEVRDPVEDLFREFFGPYYRRRPPNAQKSLGSGVIIDETGYILTNFHVVRRASRITVTLSDGRELEAKVVTSTGRSDVALLKVITNKPEKFTAIRFARDDDLILGETVLALGNPFGLGGSVSRGILSSKARRPPTEDEPLDVADWLQTDAAINPGNSGGPLVNVRGELIGINVAMYREGQGISFAVPIKRVAEALSEIFTPEGTRQLWFGARFTTGPNGIVVTNVQQGSPAAQAGIRSGDRIVGLNDKTPRNVIELNRELIAVGQQPANLTVARGSDRKSISVRMVPEASFFNAELVRQKIGATLQELTPELAARFGLRPTDGLLIAGVDRGSSAEEAELRRGHVIQAIDGRAMTAMTEAAKVLYGKKKGERAEFTLLIYRQGHVFRATTEVAVL